VNDKVAQHGMGSKDIDEEFGLCIAFARKPLQERPQQPAIVGAQNPDEFVEIVEFVGLGADHRKLTRIAGESFLSTKGIRNFIAP
jgi:hypothetical protein